MFQGVFFGCLLIFLSILAVPNLFAAKKTDIATFLDKNIPFQGWIGLIFCILGIIGFVQCALSITTMTAIFWLTGIACNAVQAILGFLLSYGLIYKYFLSKNKNSEENTEKFRSKIMPLQGKIGIIGIILGLWSIFAAIMF